MDDWAFEATTQFATPTGGAHSSKTTTSSLPPSKPNLFRSILSSSSLGLAEKDSRRIAQEAFVAIVAGGETTGRVLTTATFFVLANRAAVLPRLVAELKSVMPEADAKPTLKELEKLPWLVCFSPVALWAVSR